MLLLALKYAARGWHVFRLAPEAKKPLEGSNGFNDAKCNLEVVQKWWTEMPDANIGIATGPDSKIFVLDVDPRNDGDNTLNELEKQYGGLPKTHTVITPSNGHHLYFCLK